MKILRKLCLHFARQDGQDGKKQKENQATKVTKNQNTKIWDERNIYVQLQAHEAARSLRKETKIENFAKISNKFFITILTCSCRFLHQNYLFQLAFYFGSMHWI